MAITVRVPATTANIGPGFDSLGCAFTLYNRFSFELADSTTVEGCVEAFRGKDNLALVAFRETCHYAGVVAPSVKLIVDAEIPVSGGLGSSAAFLVGGAMSANLLLKLGLSKKEIFVIASRLEGHPDNIAPAVFGGLTAALMLDHNHIYAESYPISRAWRFCAYIADFQINTNQSREVLPKRISHADAVFNGTHLALLPAVLMYGDLSLLPIVLQDKLHQPYRIPFIADYESLSRNAFSAGAHGFFLSGSGPTLMAIYTDINYPEKVKKSLPKLIRKWNVLPLDVDREGVFQIG